MSGPRHPFRLHDLADGTLPPREARELRDALDRSPELRREFREVQALHALLSHSLDRDPPADLTVRILAAVREDRARRARILRLPGWAENALVLSGAGALAAVVAVGRAVGANWAAPWLGRLSVGAAEAVEVAKVAAIDTQGSVQHMDWTIRLVTTLTQAGWTVVGSSADVLLTGAALLLSLAGVTAWALARHDRLGKEGVGHAHLLA